ncbi:DNA-binding MarR family transcriptional regulator [Pullulanibacillus pueri]|uniref:MarR family transcriptional regulator n=1 Tax=Pullulanibacillus pueri TaxID=1437324 RepID=A0A8J3EM65_9BACL|nr:MarR family transcriptional regulator [Pullulanibacillus pueri]MBM7680931.1 DNA-binding MarR family transcriptional regulator [Pullulanibacillus pueri]GGH81382.1 MarR family transcriptional regulator [Pullulanibacillus pueri]
MEQEQNFLTLNDHLCFSIYACSRAILRLYRPYLDELKLTYPQYLVLVVLWEYEQSTVKQLGELLELDSGTLTPMLKRMEAAGLLKRSRDTKDERVIIVKITDEGKSLQEKALCIPQSLMDSTGMTTEEVNALNSAVKKLSKLVNE